VIDAVPLPDRHMSVEYARAANVDSCQVDHVCIPVVCRRTVQFSGGLFFMKFVSMSETMSW
jgi:hypothetical protein